MTIRKRLARSNIAMLVIPILAAALLLLLGLGAALLLLRGNLITLHDVVEQIETVLHGFKLTLSAFAAVAVLLMLAAVALTDLYLTRHLFRHISQPLDTLTAGVARIRDGDLDTPIGYTEADEFKAACDAVDEMAARLKASLEQQAAQQQKQELIAGMSHDLKSPLTAIRAYTERLLEGVAQDEATRQRYLQTIYAKETDMETLVNRLFAFAKMDVSAYPVRLEPLALRPALETVAEEQEGVAQEQLSRLFDVFYRGDAARTAPGNGSGIGLAVVKKSCDEMHGSVRAENGADGGLRMIVTLPLAKEEANGENTYH